MFGESVVDVSEGLRIGSADMSTGVGFSLMVILREFFSHIVTKMMNAMMKLLDPNIDILSIVASVCRNLMCLVLLMCNSFSASRESRLIRSFSIGVGCMIAGTVSKGDASRLLYVSLLILIVRLWNLMRYVPVIIRSVVPVLIVPLNSFSKIMPGWICYNSVR